MKETEMVNLVEVAIDPRSLSEAAAATREAASLAGATGEEATMATPLPTQTIREAVTVVELAAVGDGGGGARRAAERGT